MIKKERSLVSKSSNSLKATSKGTSVTSKASTWKRVSIIFIATILLSSAVTFNSGYFEVEAKKPGTDTTGPISWSNGFPSGNHTNINIHGKKLNFNCDNDGKLGAAFGKSVFVPIDTQAARDANQAPTEISNDTIGDINFVSNKRSKIVNGVVRDPCSAPFGNVTAPSTGDNNTAALIELPPGEHQVYWRILGNPFHGQGPDKTDSTVMITNPALLDTCDFLPTEYTDGSVVQWFDPDCTDCKKTDLTFGTQALRYFLNGTEMYENFTVPDAGFSISETIYNDTDTDDSVTNDDIRLANANNTLWDYTDGSSVDGANAPNTQNDLGVPLFNFTMNFMYNDTNTSTTFSGGETVYDDADDAGFGFITPGDIRVANAASVGLDEDAGEDLLTCTESEKLVGLGLVSNKGTFLKDGDELVRFGDEDNDTVEPKGQGKKQGKSVAINMTKLFVWTGFVCDAAGLDGNDDNKFSFSDFDLVNQTDLSLMPDGNITSDDLDHLATLGFVIDSTTIAAAEAIAGGDINGGIEPNEFDAWIDLALKSLEDSEGNLLCREFTDEWVFNVADIVLFGFDYENKGASLTQLRFYPVEETFFTSEG